MMCHVQVEFVHLFSKEPPALQDKARLKLPGSCLGNALSRVPMENPSWMLSIADKKKLYGARGRIEVGGPTVGVEPGQPQQRRKDSDAEPAGFHPASKTVLEEISFAYSLAGWVNLTALEGNLEDAVAMFMCK